MSVNARVLTADERGRSMTTRSGSASVNALCSIGPLSSKTTCVPSGPDQARTLCTVAAAQRHLPPPGIPVVPPPVDHPAYLGQPLMPLSNGNGTVGDPTPGDKSGGDRRSGGPDATKPSPAEQRAQEFLEQRVEGRDLKKAVAAVKALKWYDDLPSALAQSAATGKPVLLLQALGDVDGFA